MQSLCVEEGIKKMRKKSVLLSYCLRNLHLHEYLRTYVGYDVYLKACVLRYLGLYY